MNIIQQLSVIRVMCNEYETTKTQKNSEQKKQNPIRDIFMGGKSSRTWFTYIHKGRLLAETCIHLKTFPWKGARATLAKKRTSNCFMP